MTTTAIWWIRRDLRLNDNPALTAALAYKAVIPLFILDRHLLESHAAADRRLAFLFDGLRALDQSLRQRGSCLVVRRGVPAEVLPALCQEVGAAAVFAQEDTHPDARLRDAQLAQSTPLQLTPGTLIRPAGTVLKQDGDPYVVFTPFKRVWLAHPLPHERDLTAAPLNINTPPNIASVRLDDLPAQPQAALFPAGEDEARRRLAAFTGAAVGQYGEKRDFLAVDGTARLSPYLRFGMVSAREAAVRAIAYRSTDRSQSEREGADTWLSELIWREFYNHIEYHFPRVHGHNFNPAYDSLAWRDDGEAFEAWAAGQTGYPLVDAAMRQLNKTGWMHNRGRMVVASFLIKDLLIDWRKGERYFMEKLVDGDPAANNGGWQWAAGTGTDAAPYFRIFNPVSQSKKFDPQGVYIRRWVPELASLNERQIHAPWELSAVAQANAGVKIGLDYPRPIVDHKMARERTLAAYKRARAEN